MRDGVRTWGKRAVVELVMLTGDGKRQLGDLITAVTLCSSLVKKSWIVLGRRRAAAPPSRVV